MYQGHEFEIFLKLTIGGNTVLHLAARHGHLAIVSWLLQWINEDIELGNVGSLFLSSQNLRGDNPFHLAAKGGYCEIVRVLCHVSPGLVDCVNKANETPLYIAAEEGKQDIVEALLCLTNPNPLAEPIKESRSGNTVLHIAIYHKHTGIIEYLLDQRPSLLTETDNSRRTALHVVAYIKDASEIAKLLLRKNSELCHEVDVNGQTALHMAARGI